MTETLTLADRDALDEKLQEMNGAGTEPALPFIDANGIPNIAFGMAPGGDDWAVGFSTRNPDTGTQHCCWCSHDAGPCDAGAQWEPTYPLTALVATA